MWRERGLTMVVVTHDSTVARQAQRIGVMKNGRLQFKQPTRAQVRDQARTQARAAATAEDLGPDDYTDDYVPADQSSADSVSFPE
jgi:ABC-type glutathione transport system ATPase component